MAHADESDDAITKLLREARTIALVGASPNAARPSYGVMSYLIQTGYQVTPVNPGQAGGSILDRPAVARLSDIRGAIDIVDVFRNSEAAGEVVDEVLALPTRPRAIWMQLGVVNEEAAERARAAGIQVIMNRCPAIERPRLLGR